VGAPIVTAIAGVVAIAGEVKMSHPLHQAVVVAAALACGLLGYTIPNSTSKATTENGGPPFEIPDPLPVSSAAAPPGAGMNRAVVDAAARAYAEHEQGLP